MQHLRTATVSALGAAALVPLALSAGLAPAQAAPASTARATVSITAGHVDAIDVAYEGGALETSIHDETVTPDVERDPATVRLVALPQSAVSVPDDPDYAFLGAPGATAWVLPEVQDEQLLWPGISAEEVAPGNFTGDRLTVKVVGVRGPAGFSIFDTRLDGGPNVLVDSQDGLPDRIALTAGNHQHASWAFEAAGTYRVSYVVTGTVAATGQRVTSERTTITFEVRP